jgi:ribosome maturation factor RimP
MRGLSEGTLNEIRAIAAEKGCRLLAAESSGAGKYSVLRLVLERSDGSPVTIDECEAVSREASSVLDAADEIGHRYSLEVSSAGLDRRLYDLEDATRFVGRRIRVKTDEPVLPQEQGPSKAPPSPARNFRGVLRSVDGEVLTVVDEENHKIYNVRFAEIRLARLDFEWPERGRRAFPR